MNVWVGILKTFHKLLSVIDWVGKLYYKIGIVRYISALIFTAFLINFLQLLIGKGTSLQNWGTPMNSWIGILKMFHILLSVIDWVRMLNFKIGVV
jgi:hypothetical protein